MLQSIQSPIGKCFNDTYLNKKKRYDEFEIAIAFQQGEERGFDFFFRQLFPALCFFANSMINNRFEAEDIASASFIKIWKRHEQFDDAKNIRSYLYQIVRNDCLKYQQRNAKATTLRNEIEYLNIVDARDNHEEDIIRAEFYGEIFKALDGLPSECRRIFKMLYIQGKTVKEIADDLKISTSTIRTQKARGLATLKQKLKFLVFILSILFI